MSNLIISNLIYNLKTIIIEDHNYDIIPVKVIINKYSMLLSAGVDYPEFRENLPLVILVVNDIKNTIANFNEEEIIINREFIRLVNQLSDLIIFGSKE